MLVKFIVIATFGWLYYKYLENKRAKDKEMILADMTYFISRARFELYAVLVQNPLLMKDDYIVKLKKHLDFAVLFNDLLQIDLPQRIVEMKDVTYMEAEAIAQWEKLHSLSPVMLNCYFYYLTLAMEYVSKKKSRVEVKMLKVIQKNKATMAETFNALEFCKAFTQDDSKSFKVVYLKDPDNNSCLTMPFMFR